MVEIRRELTSVVDTSSALSKNVTCIGMDKKKGGQEDPDYNARQVKTNQ